MTGSRAVASHLETTADPWPKPYCSAVLPCISPYVLLLFWLPELNNGHAAPFRRIE